MWRRLRRLGALSHRERRELLLACTWQMRLRIVLLRGRGAVARLASVTPRQKPIVSAPLNPGEIERIVRWSGLICRGSCLTTAFVHKIIAARHGVDAPVTIGVALEGDTLRAHAWTGEDERARAFVPVWTDARGPRP